jgi:hypothetical protein
MRLRVKNWSDFQHFKDRQPIWIKLYRKLLEDIEWHELDPVAAKALVMIWLVASENDGELPVIKTLAFRLRMKVSELERIIPSLSHWVEQVDITLISGRYQADALEESRGEVEGETEGNPDGLLVAGKPTTPDCPHQQIVDLYHEHLPMCPQVREWTPARQKMLRSRWSEKAKRQSLDFWQRFFCYVAESEFLTGRGSSASGRDPFVVDLEWLIRPQNFVKVIEGKYHKEAA